MSGRSMFGLRKRHRLGLTLVALFASAGCLQASPGGLVLSGDVHGATPAGIVAVLDLAIQPYHETFRVTDARDQELDLLGGRIGAITLPLNHGDDFATNLAADNDLWSSVEPGQLYRFAGTNLFGITFSRDEWLPTSPPAGHERFQIGGSHAAGTAAQITAASPLNVVVYVQTRIPSYSDQPGPAADRLIFSESYLRSLRWVSEQPWIDVMSVSAGIPGNAPDGGPANSDVGEQHRLNLGMVAAGKLLVYAAGNEVAPPTVAVMGGPHWIVSVGGVRGRDGGNNAYAAKSPDFVQNYSVEGPAGKSTNATVRMNGTSFSAPAVAGRFAEAIVALREAAGLGPRIAHEGWVLPAGALGDSSFPIGPWELRSAFNATASLWEHGDWTPDPNGDLREELSQAAVPVAPVVSAAQLGWGFIGESETTRAIDILLEYARTGDRSLLAPPAEKGANIAFMQASWEARVAYWDAKMGDG